MRRRGESELHRCGLMQRANCSGDLNIKRLLDDAEFVFFERGYNVLDCADTAMLPPCAGDLNGDLFGDDSDFVGTVGGITSLCVSEEVARQFLLPAPVVLAEHCGAIGLNRVRLRSGV